MFNAFTHHHFCVLPHSSIFFPILLPVLTIFSSLFVLFFPFSFLFYSISVPFFSIPSFFSPSPSFLLLFSLYSFCSLFFFVIFSFWLCTESSDMHHQRSFRAFIVIQSNTFSEKFSAILVDVKLSFSLGLSVMFCYLLRNCWSDGL